MLLARVVSRGKEAEVRGDNEGREVEFNRGNLHIDLLDRGDDSADGDSRNLGGCSFCTNSTGEEAGEEEEIAENVHSAICAKRV